MKKIIAIFVCLISALFLASCAGKTQFRTACSSELAAAKEESSISEAKGFGGSVSYAKAATLITTAMASQVAENYDACYNQAKKARFYIRESKKGQ
jgi:PBP1b-binding outer membrane lipoprotein LpoB